MPETPPLPDARLEQIRQRLEGLMTYGGWSASGQKFGEHAHDDIAFLLAELTRLRAERDDLLRRVALWEPSTLTDVGGTQ